MWPAAVAASYLKLILVLYVLFVPDNKYDYGMDE